MRVVILVLVAIGGCGSSKECVPGATISCGCAVGTGIQTCRSDGSGYGACDCGGGTCSPSNPSGSCVAGDVCLDGICCASNQAACGSICCTNGRVCVAGSCCPADKACGANCCNSTSTCIDDGTGTLICAQSCTSSSQCPASKGCCALTQQGTGVCVPNGITTGQKCLCTTSTECQSGVCGETADASGNPTGFPVCVPNDGQPYHGCNGLVSCANGYCCVTLNGNGSSICEEPCHDSSQCGGATCTVFTSGTCNGAPGGCQ